jgi:hypothetical protein
MKKLTITIALTTLFSMSVFAHPVDVKTAQKVATTFLNNNGAKSSQLIDISKAAGFANLYIFTTENSFVVMSADDCVRPILGYSLTGKFVVEDMPENLRWWLQGYNDEIQWGIENQMKATSDISKQWKDLESGTVVLAKTRAEVGPLIMTKWDQTYPYNYHCPSCSSGGSGNHVYTGCVATAMAQVIKYHNSPTFGIGSYSYYHSIYGQQTVNFGETNYDWTNMPTKIYSSSDLTQIRAVATLIYHCGVAVDMNYGTGSSGANSTLIAPALKNYFNYSQTTTLVTRSDYSDEEWIPLMRSELDNNRPIIYGGMDSETNPQSGHSFVCDGYGKDGYNNYYFNFNWGWSGRFNGYFSIDNMTPGGDGAGGGNYNYSFLQNAVIGIVPATIGEANPPILSANLVQNNETRNVELSWNLVENAAYYHIYRGSTLIHTTASNSELSYTDVFAPFGNNIYFVRSVDGSGNLSWPSNYESITIAFPAPDILLVQQSDNGLVLSWSACDNAETYNLYCNGIFIASTENITYTDTRVIAGTLNYYVKGVNSFGDESEASDTFTISIPYSSPIVNDLSVTLSENNALLSWTSPDWCYPETETKQISYANSFTNRYGYTDELYWGHRYPSSLLTDYIGMKIYKASYYTSNKATFKPDTYKIYVYESDSDAELPSDLILNQTAFFTQYEWQDFVFSTPITIEAGKDYWVFIYNSDCNKTNYPLTFGNYSGSTNGSYYSTDPTISLNTVDNIAWLIRTYLTDGTYTYNLYDNENPVATNISDTTYTLPSITNNTIHEYTVTTNYYGGESSPSNIASLALGTTSLETLELGVNDKMTVTENSSLTVTGTLSNDNPENLILENGAQLFHSGGDVYATVKKDIAAYTTEKNGWNFIASPIATQLETATIDGLIPENEETTFDLYKYNEPNHKWYNYKPEIDNAEPGFAIEPKTGYLYASSENTTLSFAGKLHSASSITSNTLSYSADVLKGFNLVGNPLPFNAYVSKSYYKMNGTNIEAVTNSSETVAPCTGIIVEATGENESVIFSQTPMRWSNRGQLQIAVAENKLNRDGCSTSAMQVDNAIICFDEADPLQKFVFNEDNAKLYIPQGDEDYAIACANNRNEMPLNFKPSQDGTFTLTIQPESVEMSYLFLIDNMTGTHINLLTTPNYTFEAKTDDYESRFKLLFAAANKETETFDNECFGFIINGQFQSIIGQGLLQVIDLNGRFLRSANETDCIGLDGLTAGVYVIRFITANSVRTQKIVVE